MKIHMIKILTLQLLILFNVIPLLSQNQTKNVILITLDGFRWQELFRGADPGILSNPKFIKDGVMNNEFDVDVKEDRRADLLPFFWNTIATQGQLYGNRSLKSYVNCSNPYWFSYPGYNEMLIGSVDRKIRSNRKIVNANSTVLEFINQQLEYKNKVGVFSTWDVFPYILRESISGIEVNSGLELVEGNYLSDNEMLLNQVQLNSKKRQDSVTFHLAFEYLKKDCPRLMYIALDETDEYGHGGRYDQYLRAAHRADHWISNLWSWIQSQPDYKDQTTLIISTDHGRGRNVLKNWRNHGRHIFGSDEIWMAVLGPDTPASGEMKEDQVYQKQIAKTIAAFLGMDYKNNFAVGKTINSMIQPSHYIADVKVETIVSAEQKK